MSLTYDLDPTLQVARAVGVCTLRDLLLRVSDIPVDTALQRLRWEIESFAIRDVCDDKVVCPHLPRALAADMVLLGSIDEPDSCDDLANVMSETVDLLAPLQTDLGNQLLPCLVVAVPFDDPRGGSLLVEAAHRAVKPSALRRGAMVGEFGRALAGPGTRFKFLETRRAVHLEYFAVRTLLDIDGKYMNSEVERAAFATKIASRRVVQP
jgi:hypothetical protein